jgi:hypothetical protein
MATRQLARDGKPKVRLDKLDAVLAHMALETHFDRVRIFSDELAFAKYWQKEWSNKRMNQVVANIIGNHGLN